MLSIDRDDDLAGPTHTVMGKCLSTLVLSPLFLHIFPSPGYHPLRPESSGTPNDADPDEEVTAPPSRPCGHRRGASIFVDGGYRRAGRTPAVDPIFEHVLTTPNPFLRNTQVFLPVSLRSGTPGQRQGSRSPALPPRRKSIDSGKPSAPPLPKLSSAGQDSSNPLTGLKNVGLVRRFANDPKVRSCILLSILCL